MRNGERYDIVDPDKIAVTESKAYAILPKVTEMAGSEIELIYEPRHARG